MKCQVLVPVTLGVLHLVNKVLDHQAYIPIVVHLFSDAINQEQGNTIVNG
jgi:hypothetical protein